MHEQIIYYKIKTRNEIYELIIYVIYLYGCELKSLVVLVIQSFFWLRYPLSSISFLEWKSLYTNGNIIQY